LRARVNTPPASPAVEEWDLFIYWLLVEPYPSEKYEFVSWDDEIPNIWKNKIHVSNHQPVYLLSRLLYLSISHQSRLICACPQRRIFALAGRNVRGSP